MPAKQMENGLIARTMPANLTTQQMAEYTYPFQNEEKHCQFCFE